LFLLRGCNTKKTKKVHIQKQFDLLIMLIIILFYYGNNSKPSLRYEEVSNTKNSINPYNLNESQTSKKDIDNKNAEKSKPNTGGCKERYTEHKAIVSGDTYGDNYEGPSVNEIVSHDDNSDANEHIPLNEVIFPDSSSNSDNFTIIDKPVVAIENVDSISKEHKETTLPSISTCPEEISSNLSGSLYLAIKQDYVGTTVTVLLSNLSKVTGEVVFNFNHILSLKVGSKIMFINDNNIISFY
jgi:hypothetical protein